MIKIHANLEEARATILLRPTGPPEYPAELLDRVERVFGESITPEIAVSKVMEDVRDRGDDAVRDWSRRIDGVAHDPLAIPVDEIEAAADKISPELEGAFRMAAERIREYHSCQRVASWSTREMGGVLGQRVVPLRRVGIYVPGGTAPLPSSLLMAAIPAQVAGVRDIIVCTPPSLAGGSISPAVLAVAHMIGIKVILRLGGAQAIAALTFGTREVQKVDKIVGPGGLFVTLAKKQAFGHVGVDGIAGPTETVILADETANPEWVAADLLAQAEHDILATAILITPSRALAAAVQASVEQQIEHLSRSDVISQSLSNRGGIVLAPNVRTAVDIANEFAPEHLCLSVSDTDRWAGEIKNAGGLFLGERSFEVLGDYIAGPSHIMPTGGSARFASPGNVLDYVKMMNIFQLDEATSAQLSPLAATLARSENLDGHAAAAMLRNSMDGDPEIPQ